MGGRQWAVWLGSNLLKPKEETAQLPLPDRAKQVLDDVTQIKALYALMLNGKTSEADLNSTKDLLAKYISGFWLQHYADTLPKQLSEKNEKAMLEIPGLLSETEDRLLSAVRRYQKLDTDERLLVDEPFQVTFAVTMPQPRVYLDDEVAHIVRGTSTREYTIPRSPYEIAAEPRGVSTSAVKTIYFDDCVKGTRVEQAAMDKLRSLGINNDSVHHNSRIASHHRISTYANCLQRYEKFTMAGAVNAVKSGALVHILD